MNFKKTVQGFAAAGALALLAAGPASAQNLTAVTGLDNWTFSDPGLVAIPGMVSNTFANAAGQRFIVTFSSECAVLAPSVSAWVDVDIQAIHQGTGAVYTLRPTAGALDAFCGAGTINGYVYGTHSVTAVANGLPAGSYRVKVLSRLDGGATGGWFGERTLVVSR